MTINEFEDYMRILLSAGATMILVGGSLYFMLEAYKDFKRN